MIFSWATFSKATLGRNAPFSAVRAPFSAPSFSPLLIFLLCLPFTLFSSSSFGARKGTPCRFDALAWEKARLLMLDKIADRQKTQPIVLRDDEWQYDEKEKAALLAAVDWAKQEELVFPHAIRIAVQSGHPHAQALVLAARFRYEAVRVLGNSAYSLYIHTDQRSLLLAIAATHEAHRQVLYDLMHWIPTDQVDAFVFPSLPILEWDYPLVIAALENRSHVNFTEKAIKRGSTEMLAQLLDAGFVPSLYAYKFLTALPGFHKRILKALNLSLNKPIEATGDYDLIEHCSETFSPVHTRVLETMAAHPYYKGPVITEMLKRWTFESGSKKAWKALWPDDRGVELVDVAKLLDRGHWKILESVTKHWRQPEWQQLQKLVATDYREPQGPTFMTKHKVSSGTAERYLELRMKGARP